MGDAFKYNPDSGLSSLDRTLLKGAAAHKSWVEISAMVGGVLSPAEAADRVLTALEARSTTSMTLAQKNMLLIDDMMAVKDSLMEKAVSFGNIDAAKPLISILALLEKTMAAQKIDLAKAMAEISVAHGHLMLRAISLAMEITHTELQVRYPEIHKGELLAIFAKAIPAAVKEIESREAQGE